MPPTLIGLAYLDGTRLPNVPYNGTHVDLTQPGTLNGWKIIVQGAQVVFVSPPGWNGKTVAPDAPKDAPRMLVQIPRARVALCWSGAEEDVSKLEGQWPPLAPPKAEGKAKP